MQRDSVSTDLGPFGLAHSRQGSKVFSSPDSVRARTSRGPFGDRHAAWMSFLSLYVLQSFQSQVKEKSTTSYALC